jgi:8-oxo-dGTP pyrophosphatase MutT (NUDIX family)
VLVSRKWSGKTLAAHKADRAAVVRAALEEAGIDPDDHDELAVTGNDGRWSWQTIPRTRLDWRTYAAAIADAIATRERWRRQYETAKAARASPAASAAA